MYSISPVLPSNERPATAALELSKCQMSKE
jgi:hypothetical protein